MEYKPWTDEKLPFDVKKIEFINKIGETWMRLDCNQTNNPNDCIAIQEILQHYGTEYMKIQYKMLKCEKDAENETYSTPMQTIYENCMNNAEKEFDLMINSYYKKLFELTSKSSNN